MKQSRKIFISHITHVSDSLGVRGVYVDLRLRMRVLFGGCQRFWSWDLSYRHFGLARLHFGQVGQSCLQ